MTEKTKIKIEQLIHFGITNTFSVQQRIGFNNTFDPLFGSSPDSGQLCGFNYSGGGVVGYTVLANIGDTIDASTAGWSSYTTVTNNGVHYFGISFNNNGVTNYGFLVANTSGYGTHSSDISFSLAAYSYDNTGAAITVVPEPSTYALFGLGAIGMLMVLRRKKTA